MALINIPEHIINKITLDMNHIDIKPILKIKEEKSKFNGRVLLDSDAYYEVDSASIVWDEDGRNRTAEMRQLYNHIFQEQKRSVRDVVALMAVGKTYYVRSYNAEQLFYVKTFKIGELMYNLGCVCMAKRDMKSLRKNKEDEADGYSYMYLDDFDYKFRFNPGQAFSDAYLNINCHQHLHHIEELHTFESLMLCYDHFKKHLDQYEFSTYYTMETLEQLMKGC